MAIKDISDTLFLGKVWQHFEELPSTNDFLANSGIFTEGVVATTFNQTAGRGQMGNRWLAEPNQNLAYSIRLNPTYLEAKEQFHLNKIIALAVHDLIDAEMSNPKCQNSSDAPSNFKLPTIKWANDILINDKKVCGILIQNTISGRSLQSSIIGIGININQLIFPKDLNATSLSLETGKKYDLMPLINKLTQCIEFRYLQSKSQRNFAKIHEEYLSKMYRFGVEALYKRTFDDTVFMGKIVGVSPFGQLEIMSNKGIELFDIKEIKFQF